jgi:hypothetical protein
MEKSEICISGIASLSKHSLPRQPNSIEEKKAWFDNNQFQNKRHKQLTKVRTGGFTSLERSVAKQFATGGFKTGSSVHQIHTCPKRF